MTRVVVLGGGAWGTALAMLAQENGAATRLWMRRPEAAAEASRTRDGGKYLPGVGIPRGIDVVSGADVRGADLYVGAVPAQFIRSTASGLRGALDAGAILVSAAKGLEQGTRRRPTEVWREAAGASRFAVLSGPSHAEEVARGLPATVVAASEDAGAASAVQAAFSNGHFRVYTSDDPLGVELAGALKNVVAVAAGIGDGLGLGDNAKAALLSRGIVEMARFGRAEGARRETFFGLSGIGDLITTCASPHGRNLRVGREVGRGRTLDEALGSIAGVAEGVWTSRAVTERAKALDVQMPIAQAVADVLFGGVAPRDALRGLMARAPRSEAEDLRG